MTELPFPERIGQLTQQYEDLRLKISDPEVVANQKEYLKHLREMQQLEGLYHLNEEYQSVAKSLEDNIGLRKESEGEMLELVEEEVREGEVRLEQLVEAIKMELAPKDPLDNRDVIVEVRAGTGGDEASLFAADLYRMYSRYAEKNRLRVELLDYNETGLKGFKEVIFSLSGKEVFGRMKFETGVHRVQRIPETESGGRIHTSAATVAVLPQAEDEDVEIHDADLKIDTFRASGAGGQHVNTTDSAVRITHLPTGTVVSCQDEKSQHKNKAKAMKVLRARIFEEIERQRNQELAQERKQQVGSGDRSERIRTYNYPQNRVTDHRINLTLHKLDLFVTGDMDEVISALRMDERQKKLAGFGG